MKKLFNPSAIPAGKELRHLALGLGILAFLSLPAADLLNGTLKIRGGRYLTFDDSPFWFSFLAVFIAVLGVVALGYMLSAVVAFLRRRRERPPISHFTDNSE
jgi:hypothetical protein